jgi:hypothetical protein
MSQISLPVSLGEAIDKLTILHIKLSKIQDSRRDDVQKEFDVLYEVLKEYVTKYNYHYMTLYQINRTLWEIQDKFHHKETSKQEGAEICRTILIENDRRYRVKAKINTAANSVLREQKGYDLKKVVLYSHLGLGDMFWMNGAVRYLATDFDEVLVICKKRNEVNVRAMYADDPSIKLFVIDDDNDLYPWHLKKSIFSDQGYKVLGCGGFSDRDVPMIYNLPESFYDDIGIPFNVRLSYFHVPKTEKAFELASMYQQPYIVVHAESSVHKAEIGQLLIAKGETRLILDLNTNVYSRYTNPVEWELAQHVVGKPLMDYTVLIEGAAEIHMIESSIYCMASHLDLSKVQKRVCYEPWGGNAERLGTFTTGNISNQGCS